MIEQIKRKGQKILNTQVKVKHVLFIGAVVGIVTKIHILNTVNDNLYDLTEFMAGCLTRKTQT